MTETGGPGAAQQSALTLADVARHAGVSPMTVSNVINGRPGVRPATRQRVLDAVAATGYRVNEVARALAGGRSRVLSVFTPQLNRPYAAEVVQGAAQAAEALHYDLVVVMRSGGGGADLSLMARLSAGALLIQPSGGDWPRRSDLPPHLVSVDGPGERVLGADNAGGARQATAHLLALGHTRVGLISGLLAEPDGPQTGRDDAAERLSGYQETLRAAGLDPLTYVRHGDYTQESGARAARELLALSPPPTALFAAGDAMALGALHAAQDLGFRVPQDLSVVGFDDLPVAAAARPALTTVRQPLRQMGEVAVRLLVELAGGGAPELPPPFPTGLVVRESSGPVPPSGA